MWRIRGRVLIFVVIVILGVAPSTASASLPTVTNLSEVQTYGSDGFYEVVFRLGSWACSPGGGCTGGASGAYTSGDNPTAVVWRYKIGSGSWTEISHPCDWASASSDRMCGYSWNYDKLVVSSLSAGSQVSAQAALENLDGRSAWLPAATATAKADTVAAQVANSTGVVDGRTLTGTTVTFSASGSTAASGSIASYAWDLDGDAVFESIGGASASNSWSTPGTKTVSVRVTSAGGETGTASTSVEVRSAPPAGEPGVSINAGGTYTNTKNVTLNVVWPAYATAMRISNDGGFFVSKTVTRDLAATQDWELDDTVMGKFPKVVYVRFSGSGIDETKTYSDDIILDTTAPEVTSIDATPTASNSVVALRTRKSSTLRWNLSVRATDDNSGVGRVYVNTRKSSVGGLTVDYGSKIRLATSKKAVWVRVVDRAGNTSDWQKVKLKRSKGLASAKTARHR